MIALEGVSKSFGGRRVLDALSLEVDPGERVALVGANGAGKTTLIRCLLGEYRCAGGVRIGGASPREERTRVLRRVGFVPQLPPPLKMPVGQLIRFADGVRGGGGRARIEEVAGGLGLELRDVWGQAFVNLSGGQKQKLLIALALRDENDLLVLDEPSANLDPEARESFFELLGRHDLRATMLISIHRLDDVADLVGRVVELDRGRLVVDRSIGERREMGRAPNALG